MTGCSHLWVWAHVEMREVGAKPLNFLCSCDFKILWLQDSFQPTLLSIAKAGGSQIFNLKQKKPLVHRTVSSSIIIKTSLYFLHILFVAECVCQDIYVEIRAQFVGVHLLFSPCRLLGQNLGHHLGDKNLYPLNHLTDCIAPLMNTFIKH